MSAKNKPALLLVADTFPPKVDGTVRFIEEFVSRAKDEFRITALAPNFSGNKKLPIKTIFLPISKRIQPLPDYPTIKLSWSNLNKIKQAVKESDIVFVQGPALASLLALHYSKKYDKKSFFYLHVLPWELFEFSSSLPLRRLLAWLVKKMFLHSYNDVDNIIVPYSRLRDKLQEEGLNAKSAICHLGVDISRFKPTKNKTEIRKKLKLPLNKKIIGYVGRISPEKNIPTLFKAFRKLPGQKGLLLLLVGSGSKKEEAKFKKIPNCRITGFVDNVQEYLQAMDLFIMPSLTETTSLATLEAMSSGLPVLATKVGYIQDYLVSGHNGQFFPKRNSSILSMKMYHLLSDKISCQKLGENARRTAAYTFSWEKSIQRIKRVLKRES
ncbi:glycosyltransferase [Candidatus Woesearchaeota archaeon]|nr:glycosyltransferase [Candidatus Woesearchaeota archaeon]